MGLLGGSGYMSQGTRQPFSSSYNVAESQHEMMMRMLAGGLQPPFGYGSPAGMAAMSQEEAARYRARGTQAAQQPYGVAGSPFDLNSQAYRNWQENRRQCMQPRVKHIDSIDVTPRERARKAINGAVEAVKKAQEVG